MVDEVKGGCSGSRGDSQLSRPGLRVGGDAGSGVILQWHPSTALIAVLIMSNDAKHPKSDHDRTRNKKRSMRILAWSRKK